MLNHSLNLIKTTLQTFNKSKLKIIQKLKGNLICPNFIIILNKRLLPNNKSTKAEMRLTRLCLITLKIVIEGMYRIKDSNR